MPSFHHPRWCLAIAALCGAFAHAAPASAPNAADTAAAQHARGLRDAIALRQQQLFDSKNITSAPQQHSSASLSELAVDQQDTPGATAK